MSSSGNCVSNKTDLTAPTLTRERFQSDIPVQTLRMINAEYGLDNLVNPGCVIEETTCRDYGDNTEARSIFDVNTITAAKIPVDPTFPTPDNCPYRQENDLKENEEDPSAKPKRSVHSRRKRGRLTKLLILCCTSGNDNQEDSFETKSRDEEVPNSTTLDTSTDNIPNFNHPKTPSCAASYTTSSVLDVNSAPPQNVMYHTHTTVASGEYDATVNLSISQHTGLAGITSSIVHETTQQQQQQQQHDECILSRCTGVLDGEVVSINVLNSLPTSVVSYQNTSLSDDQYIRPIDNVLTPLVQLQEACASHEQNERQVYCSQATTNGIRKHSANNDEDKISLDSTRSRHSIGKESSDVKPSCSTECLEQSLKFENESEEIISQRSSCASPAELTKAEDLTVVENDKTSLRDQSVATMKKVVDDFKTSLQEQSAATMSTKVNDISKTNPNTLPQESHMESDEDHFEHVVKRHRDGTWYVLRRCKKQQHSACSRSEHSSRRDGDHLREDEVKAVNNDVIVLSSEEKCKEMEWIKQRRLLLKTLNKYADDLKLRMTKNAKKVHFSFDTKFNDSIENESNEDGYNHSNKRLEKTVKSSKRSLQMYKKNSGGASNYGSNNKVQVLLVQSPSPLPYSIDSPAKANKLDNTVNSTSTNSSVEEIRSHSSAKRSKHSVKSSHRTLIDSRRSPNESPNSAKELTYVTKSTQTSPEGAILSPKGSRSSAKMRSALPKKESGGNETCGTSDKSRRYRRKMPSKNDRYQTLAEL